MMPTRITPRCRPGPESELWRLSAELARFTALQRSGGGDVELAGRLRCILDDALEVLYDLAADPDLDDVRSWQIVATRDLLASHLRAASHIESAEAQPQLLLQVLTRAASHLLEVDVLSGGR